MIALAVLVGILFLLFLIGQVRVGGEVEYAHTGVTVYLRFWWFQILVYPSKEGKKEQPKKKCTPKKKADEETEKPKEEKRGGSFALFKKLLPVALEAVGALKRKIRIDKLILHLTWAAKDPASAAMGYGAANASMGMLYPVLDQNFKIKKCDVQIDLSFERSEPEIYGNAALSLTVGQLLHLVFHYGVKAIMVYKNNVRHRSA